MNSKTNSRSQKTLAAMILVAAVLAPAAGARADNPTPAYVSPGIGTVIANWLLQLMAK